MEMDVGCFRAFYTPTGFKPTPGSSSSLGRRSWTPHPNFNGLGCLRRLASTLTTGFPLDRPRTTHFQLWGDKMSQLLDKLTPTFDLRRVKSSGFVGENKSRARPEQQNEIVETCCSGPHDKWQICVEETPPQSVTPFNVPSTIRPT